LHLKINKLVWLVKKFSLVSFLLLGVGLSYVVVIGAFVLVAGAKLKAIGMDLVGENFVSLGNYAVWVLETTTNSVLRFGLWLAAATGPFLVILALLRNKIVGKQQSISQ